ncbi:MAG: hypothetical protein P8077_02950 [Gammaproteobacteria bacterium]
MIEVTSQSNDSAEAYAISSTVVSKFIQDSADAKRRESKEAFVFIDNQVKSYKEQLVGAESRLKAFKINNQEGTEDSVHQRLSDLRAKIQELQLKIEEELTKRKEVEAQLQKESGSDCRNYAINYDYFDWITPKPTLILCQSSCRLNHLSKLFQTARRNPPVQKKSRNL